MTYATRDASVATGMPFECFEFETPIGTFRYTTLHEEVTVDGKLFTPCDGIGRSDADINGIVDSLQTMDFIIPLDDPLAKGFRKRTLPEYCTTRVYRCHYGDDYSTEFRIEWKGEAIGYGQEPGAFVISTQSILQSKIQGSQCTIYTTLSCNHRVYDEHCTLDRGDFTVSTEVTEIDGIEVHVVDQQHTPSELRLGEITNTRTGEKRTVFQAVDDIITITYPFVDIVIGDTVELTMGCDLLHATCQSRFDNVINFLGFRYIPLENLFVNSGDQVVTQTTEKRVFVPIRWTETFARV